MDGDDFKKLLRVAAWATVFFYISRLVYKYPKSFFAVCGVVLFINWKQGNKSIDEIVFAATVYLGFWCIVNVCVMVWNGMHHGIHPVSSFAAMAGLVFLPVFKGAMQESIFLSVRICSGALLLIIGGLVAAAIIQHRIERKRGYVAVTDDDDDGYVPTRSQRSEPPRSASAAPLMEFRPGSKYARR